MKWFHPFHMVSYSPWPILSSFGVMNMMISLYVYLNINYSLFVFMLCLFNVILVVTQWWRDVVRESTFQGFHTMKVCKGIYMGFIMFIASEVMFFFSFFFGYFFLALSPDVSVGSTWPPVSIVPVDYSHIPMLNTVILLSSGVSMTWSHHSLIAGNSSETKIGLLLTIIQGVVFSVIQFMEYYDCSFSVADSAFGSLFFISTGFHGIHVIIGSIFLMVSFTRLLKNHLSNKHHICFEAGAWYWHFVDVVWLFLFLVIYWWGC
nr:cytochrome c oxidase subunit III [Anaticola crassicornis]